MDESPGPAAQEEQNPVHSGGTEKILNPWLAAVFSGIVPGWGQWYEGRTWDGLKFSGALFFITLFSLWLRVFLHDLSADLFIQSVSIVLFLGIWMYGMYEAYTTAEKINRGERGFSGKSMRFWFPAVVLVCIVAYLFFIVIVAAGFMAAWAIIPGIGDHGNGFVDMNVSATAEKPDAGRIIVTVRNVPDPDRIFELYAKVTDDAGNTRTQVIGLDYSKVEEGRSMVFFGTYAGRDHVTATVVFNDRNVTQILDTYV